MDQIRSRKIREDLQITRTITGNQKMEVTFRNVSKSYGKFTVLNRLNLTIQSGALHFLLGPSGCGKTTTLRILAGLESASDGQIYFDHKDVTKVPAANRGIGMVFQNYALWPHMTVAKNITYGLKLRNLPKDVIQRRLDDVLSLTQLTRHSERSPGQLSGGEQQRVALARALAIRPNVLLLDEPLSNLDAKLRHEMRENICRIHNQTGITTVYVTHDQKEALSMGTSISVMHSGSLIQTATPRDLYCTPESPFVAGFVGEMNLLKGIYKGIDKGVDSGNSGDDHVIETNLGLIKSRRIFGDILPGEQAFLAIRPEAVELIFGQPTLLDNTFQMDLSHLTYLGESEQMVFLRGDSTIRANLFNPGEQKLKDGDAVLVRLPSQSTLILPPDGPWLRGS